MSEELIYFGQRQKKLIYRTTPFPKGKSHSYSVWRIPQDMRKGLEYTTTLVFKKFIREDYLGVPLDTDREDVIKLLEMDKFRRAAWKAARNLNQ